MKPLPYVISKRAISDIEEIWSYTVGKWSVAQSDRYCELIFNEISYICQDPLSGKSIEDVRIGYRVSKAKSHLIFYRVVNNVVEVVRILHERMDIESHLGD